jgi:hypothetical protein
MWAKEHLTLKHPDTFGERLISNPGGQLMNLYQIRFTTDVHWKNNGKLKLLIIVGTRRRSSGFLLSSRSAEHTLIASLPTPGQNYDYNLNGVFFKDLSLLLPMSTWTLWATTWARPWATLSMLATTDGSY